MVSTTPDVSSPPSPPTDTVDPARRTYQQAALRGPALLVLGIAVFIVVVGVVGSALTSGNTTTLSVQRITIPGGNVVQLTPATSALHSIVGAGDPPSDILGDLAVPAGSRVTGTVDSDQGAAQFDRTVTFTVGLSADQVVALYRKLLPHLGWQVIYFGTGAQRDGQGTEVLAKHGSGDGYYWEVGAVVSPTTSTSTTPFSLELFQLPDGN